MSRLDEAKYRASEAKLFEAYGVAPEEHFVDVPELGTRVRLLEIGQGEPVVMIHGSPNAAAAWLPLATAMPGKRCLLLERPGAGLSTPVRRWGAHREQVAALLSTVLDARGHDAADFVGSSFGGLYAYELALLAPARVRRLVIMGCPAGPAALLPGIFRMLALPLPHALLGLGLRPDVEESKKMWREVGCGAAIDCGALPEAMFEWYSSLLCHTDTLRHLVDEIRAIATPFGYRNHAVISDAELAGLASPALYLWGDLDNFGPPEQGERLCGLTPGAEIERFAGFGHLPWIDDPKRIASRLAAFFVDDQEKPQRVSA